MKLLLFAPALIPLLLFSQSRKERKALEAQLKADQHIITNLKSHILFLTNKTNTGSNDAITAEYISKQFTLAGLQPKGTNAFIQPFSIDDGKKIQPSTYLKVNDASLILHKEFFPLPYSAEKKVTGMPAIALREKGVPWFTDLKSWFEDGSKTPAININELIKKEAVRVAAKGATALFLFNSGLVADSVVFNSKDKSSPATIPVIYVTSLADKKYFSDHSQILDIDLLVAFKESRMNGNNIIGYLNNQASSTVVIAAHYHNAASINKSDRVAGADDNASGVAMLIELAKMLTASKAKSSNYIFIASGGVDNGFSGSSYWLENNAVNTPINFMVDVDMVGSYGTNKKLLIKGYPTSLVWGEVIASMNNTKPAIQVDTLSTISGLPSYFYNKSLPVLSVSSSTHAAYANQSDSEDKINYAGELQIAKFITRLIEITVLKGKAAFTKTSN